MINGGRIPSHREEGCLESCVLKLSPWVSFSTSKNSQLHT